MDDIRLALMCGLDIPIPECQLVIHQPNIIEIAHLGERDFFTAVQTICIDKNMVIQDKAVLDNTSNFQIFMTIMSEKETADKKVAVQQLMLLMFPDYKVNFTPRSIMFSKRDSMDMVIIDENNFEPLQEAITQVCCLRSGHGEQSSFNPSDDKAREIAQKLMRGRQRVAAQKGEADASIFTQYLSILTIGLNAMPLSETQKLTIFQLYDLVERYTLYVNWDIDIRSRLAGGKPDSKPDNWMKNIH